MKEEIDGLLGDKVKAAEALEETHAEYALKQEGL